MKPRAQKVQYCAPGSHYIQFQKGQLHLIFYTELRKQEKNKCNFKNSLHVFSLACFALAPLHAIQVTSRQTNKFIILVSAHLTNEAVK